MKLNGIEICQKQMKNFVKERRLKHNKKQKDNVCYTFIFSLHQFDQMLPSQVIQLKMDLGLLSVSSDC